MWPFKKQPKVGELSNVAYARWLRAGSPQPLVEFLTYDEDHQETLAGIGDDYIEDVAETNAGAIADVLTAMAEGLAEGGAQPPDAGGDEGDYAANLALGALGAKTPQNRPRQPRGPRPLSMAGVTERRAERIQADQDDADAPKRLAGFLPDSMRPSEDAETG